MQEASQIQWRNVHGFALALSSPKNFQQLISYSISLYLTLYIAVVFGVYDDKGGSAKHAPPEPFGR